MVRSTSLVLPERDKTPVLLGADKERELVSSHLLGFAEVCQELASTWLEGTVVDHSWASDQESDCQELGGNT